MQTASQTSGGQVVGLPERQNGVGQGLGSVRRARERVEAELRSSRSQETRNQNPSLSSDTILESPASSHPEKQSSTSQPRQATIAPPRVRQPPPAVSSQPIRANPGAIGSAIGKPAAMPQQPPRQLVGTSRRTTNSPIKEEFAEEDSLPGRSPRPAAPQLPGSSAAELAEFFRTTGPQIRSPPKGTSKPRKYGEVSPESPAGVHELPASTPSGSRPSTTSSIGSIPEFPIPVPSTPRRVPNLGPPPTRRGGSNYPPQSSYVSPIPEESPQRSHGSFASSQVIPSSWGSGPPDHYFSEGPEELSDEDELNEDEDGRGSRGADHDEESGLVRKASLGKRHKPSLTTIKSVERLEEDAKVPPLKLKDRSLKSKASYEDVEPAPRPCPRSSSSIPVPGLVASRQPDSPTSSISSKGNPFRSPAASRGGSSPESLNDLTSSQPSPLSPKIDPRINRILGSLEKGGALDPKVSNSFTSANKGDRKPGMRRPARLNLDAVKEADERGSLTSLRDLITRATRLASNLDRGRTASRIDLQLSGDEKDMYRERHSGSISDILDSFPPPAVATPTGDRSSRYHSPFPSSPLARGHYKNSCRPPTEKRGRRCCGMPIWPFILLCIIAILLIVAAVVIPITLVVIPRRHHNLDIMSEQNLSRCQKDLVCSNGGANVIISNVCHCNCPKGFTGAQCTVTSDDGCTVINTVPMSSGAAVQDVTVGSSIPRLLDLAQTKFGIPLNTSILFPFFDASKLSCSSENALVNFNGRSQRRSVAFSKPSSETSPAPAAKAELRQKRQTAIAQAITSNDIIMAATATASSYVPTATSANLNTDNTAIDFGRVAVLYVVQQTKQINVAVQVQVALQDFFGGTGGETVRVQGTAIIVDFGKGMVSLGNGTAVGGKWRGQ